MRDYGGDITWVPYTPLKIATQPKSVTVAEGEVAKVTVKAEGDGLYYRWYYKNAGASSYTYTSSFKGNTYSVTMNDARNGRQVLCRVYDKYGNVVQTNTVKLSMEKSTVKITQQPVSVTVANGATAKVTVKATGDGLTYRWYFKNVGDTKYYYTSSFTGNTYSVTMNEARNGRQVLCRVYDKYGNVVQTNTVKLSMASGLRIVTQPKDAYTQLGSKINISVKAEGEGLTYDWYVKDVIDPEYVLSSIKSSTYAPYMTEDKAGRYAYCVITDKYGNSVKTDVVRMWLTATITKQPVSVTVAEGKTAKVTVGAVGDGLTYEWFYKNKGDSAFTYTSTYTTNTYTMTMTNAQAGKRPMAQKQIMEVSTSTLSARGSMNLPKSVT